MDTINIILALFSIALGIIGWLAPAYVAQVLDVTPGPSTMGLSEIRAASGALFVGLGVGVLWLGTPQAAAMLGFAWGAASLGRLTSLLVDGQTRKKWGFFICEAAVGLLALWNLVPTV
jgi:hypothetical protein